MGKIEDTRTAGFNWSILTVSTRSLLQVLNAFSSRCSTRIKSAFKVGSERKKTWEQELELRVACALCADSRSRKAQVAGELSWVVKEIQDFISPSKRNVDR